MQYQLNHFVITQRNILKIWSHPVPEVLMSHIFSPGIPENQQRHTAALKLCHCKAISLQATALFAQVISSKSPAKLLQGFPPGTCVGQPEISLIYQVEVEKQEKERNKHKRWVPFNTRVSAEVTAMTRSWRRARAPCMHLSGIPPRLQAGILTHGNCKAGKAGAPAETTQPLVPQHSLPAVTKCLAQPRLAELHEGAQTILQQPFSTTSTGDRHEEDRGKARHLAPQLA